MSKHHHWLLALSWFVIAAELLLLIVNHDAVVDWVSHNLWIVLIPFTKVIFKKLAVSKLVATLKSLLMLGWHVAKLFILKLLKTLFLRYGVYFSQRRWYWIRYLKVMFLRRGKQFFRQLRAFWGGYDRPSRVVIFVAFFPAIVLLSFLALSFNVTRRTLVKRTQESAVFTAAASAGRRSRGIRAWIEKLDYLTLQKIREITLRYRQIEQAPNSDKPGD